MSGGGFGSMGSSRTEPVAWATARPSRSSISASTVLKAEPAWRMRLRTTTVSASIVQGRRKRSDTLTVRTSVAGGAPVRAAEDMPSSAMGVKVIEPSLAGEPGAQHLAQPPTTPSSPRSGAVHEHADGQRSDEAAHQGPQLLEPREREHAPVRNGPPYRLVEHRAILRGPPAGRPGR